MGEHHNYVKFRIETHHGAAALISGDFSIRVDAHALKDVAGPRRSAGHDPEEGDRQSPYTSTPHTGTFKRTHDCVEM